MADGPHRTRRWLHDEVKSIGRENLDGLHVSRYDENSTFTWLLEPMMLHAGFEIRDASYSDDGFFAKYLLAVRE